MPDKQTVENKPFIIENILSLLFFLINRGTPIPRLQIETENYNNLPASMSVLLHSIPLSNQSDLFKIRLYHSPDKNFQRLPLALIVLISLFRFLLPILLWALHIVATLILILLSQDESTSGPLHLLFHCLEHFSS